MYFIDKQRYWNEVKDIAIYVSKERYSLEEVIDGHEWIIYNKYHYEILIHSNNTDRATDIGVSSFFSLDEILTIYAYYAFLSDVEEYILSHKDVYSKTFPKRIRKLKSNLNSSFLSLPL